jgi:hypothetical protein
MEYLPLGDLDKCYKEALPEVRVNTVAAQLLEGLAKMHEMGFAHRDLKPQVSFAPLLRHGANSSRTFLWCVKIPSGSRLGISASQNVSKATPQTSGLPLELESSPRPKYKDCCKILLKRPYTLKPLTCGHLAVYCFIS